MIDRHWDGIASYCHPENKGSLGLVEGLNNKIRVLQRRAYGYRDEDYLKLKIVAAFLPPLTRSTEKTYCHPRRSCCLEDEIRQVFNHIDSLTRAYPVDTPTCREAPLASQIRVKIGGRDCLRGRKPQRHPTSGLKNSIYFYRVC